MTVTMLTIAVRKSFVFGTAVNFPRLSVAMESNTSVGAPVPRLQWGS
jgi:hypothetical protein